MDKDRLIFRQLFDATSSTYTYLIGDAPSREAVIIDPVFEQHFRDLALVEELDLRLVASLDTHCHADHVTGSWLLHEATGCRVGVSKRSEGQITGPDLWLGQGDHVPFGDHWLEVRETPGHTAGCLTFVTDDHGMVFTGDCLLIRGAGRCDFQQGDAHTMFKSITGQILSLPDDCLIYPAHDYAGRTVSSVREERKYNPRLGGQADERDFVGFMENLNLPHPKQMDIAVPANMRSGKPETGSAPRPADWGPVRQGYSGLLGIDAHWVSEHLDDVHVLDVRHNEELHETLGRIAGAQWIPLHQLKDRLGEVPRDKPVVAVCHAGMRSGQATQILSKAGVTRVANLLGGMLLWNQQGYPVQKLPQAGRA